MPIDNPDDRGTEKDGSESQLYCKYCYQHGHFTNPDLTLEKMKENAFRLLKEQHIENSTIERSLSKMDSLQRWKQSAGSAK